MDRPALMDGWSAMCHVQVAGVAMAEDPTRSYYNMAEASPF